MYDDEDMKITFIHNFNANAMPYNSICSTPGDTQLERMCLDILFSLFLTLDETNHQKQPFRDI